MTASEELERAPDRPVKLGLALSGGGFRASFFHIGVLAQLAIQGLLKHIEVISTVSGGSIIGAYYYLHARNLLQNKTDAQIADQDYKRLVERIERDFFAAVASNFRLSTFAKLGPNLRTAWPDYSHSDRIAQLYDERLYRPVFHEGDPRPLAQLPPVEMRLLKIYPPESQGKFDPETDNASRVAKVPILLVNATTLNTGNNWRFTAKQMGEPRPSEPRAEIDRKPIRLRQPDDYDKIVKRQQDFSLGHAVAASAAVPGIFHPLAITDLYPSDIRVQLVDGGVHDNQGVQGLLDTDCTHFIVSDASYQTDFEKRPETQVGSVLNRVNDVIWDRLREEQMVRLFGTKANPRVAFMHLRKGLSITERAWSDPITGEAAEPDIERRDAPAADDIGVKPNVQELLSRVRTDLDSFTEVEAYSLMLDGYHITGAVLPRAADIARLAANPPDPDTQRWRFLKIAAWMTEPSQAYLDQLGAANRKFFKILYLLQPKPLAIAARAARSLLVFALSLGLIYLLWRERISVGALLLAGLLFVVFYYSRRLAPARIIRIPLERAKRFVGRAALWATLTPFVFLYLKLINPLFLRLGTIDRLRGQRPLSKPASDDVAYNANRT